LILNVLDLIRDVVCHCDWRCNKGKISVNVKNENIRGTKQFYVNFSFNLQCGQGVDIIECWGNWRKLGALASITLYNPFMTHNAALRATHSDWRHKLGLDGIFNVNCASCYFDNKL